MIRVWQQRVLHIERTLLDKYICNPYEPCNNPNFPHYLAVSGPYGSAGFLAHADGPFGLSSHSAPWLSVDSMLVARSRRSAKGSGALLLPVIFNNGNNTYDIEQQY